MSIVIEKLNLCPVILASRTVNPLWTSHTVEHLSSICLQVVANIRIFKYICEYSLQIIFIFVFTVKKILNNIHIRILSRLG